MDIVLKISQKMYRCQSQLTLRLLVANSTITNDAKKNSEITETQAYGYSSESTQ